MKIGIVGLGVVGTAIKKGFEKLGHTVVGHDIKLNTSLQDVLKCDIVYLCLPTNPSFDGSCNVDSIGETVQQLKELNYRGIIAVKSTIIPGTMKILETLFPENRICHVPEFLREKHAYKDFTSRHNVLVIGAHSKKCYELVEKSHGKYPKKVVKLTPYEAEFVKYYSNVFKAVKVTFANSFGKVCDKLGVDYSKVLQTYKLEKVPETAYLNYSPDLGGFGGMCLPKDVMAFNKLADDLHVNVDLFKFIQEENKKFI